MQLKTAVYKVQITSCTVCCDRRGSYRSAREELPARTSSMADSDAEDDYEVHNDSDSDQLSLSQLSVNRSRRTYARCVWCSSATHDLLSCRAARAPAFLCFLCRSAWATSSRLPNMPYWHQHGPASVLVEVTCCRSWQFIVYGPYVQCSLRFAFLFDLF